MMVDRARHVSEFLRDQGRFGRQYGDDPWNCSTSPADWCRELGWPDFAAAWRHITDIAECEAVAADGLVQLWEQGIGDALPVVEAPYQPGDIGVVEAHGLQAGAVFSGEHWGLRRARGMRMAAPGEVRVLKAWRP
jgi:hypothetical protein